MSLCPSAVAAAGACLFSPHPSGAPLILNITDANLKRYSSFSTHSQCADDVDCLLDKPSLAING